jgi:tetratricopeptide (TPR) repeat protein
VPLSLALKIKAKVGELMTSNTREKVIIVIYSILSIIVGFILGILMPEWLTLKVLLIFPIGTISFGVILTSGLFWGLYKKRIKPCLACCFISSLIGGLMFLAVYYSHYKGFLIESSYLGSFTYKENPISFFQFLRWTIENTEVSFFYRSPSTAKESFQIVWYNYLSFCIYFLGAMIGSGCPIFLLIGMNDFEKGKASGEGNTNDEMQDFYGLGLTCFNMGNYASAINNLNKSIELQPEYDDAYCVRGQCYFQLGEYEKAIKDFGKAIELSPEESWYIFNRGLCYYFLKDYIKAILDFTATVTIEPDAVDALNYLGLCYYKLSEYEGAIDYFSKVMQKRADWGRYNRGRCYYKVSKYERAIIDFDKAIELNPKSEKAFYWRGLCYFELGDFLRALANLDKAVQLKPDWEKVFYWRGVCYYELGCYENAISDLNASIELNPNYREFFWKRAKAYEKLEKWNEAARDFELAAGLAPNLQLEAYD